MGPVGGRRRRRLPGEALDRRFEAVIFDWDGTAIPDRRADATAVRSVVEALCAQGMHLVLVSGTNVSNVDGQLAARPTGPGTLHLCLNRGSEVFEVDADGPRCVDRRAATAEEERALTTAAEGVARWLMRRGLQAGLVTDRLNRRKIDLIPEPAWADPPKHLIGELLEAVEARLRARGVVSLAQVVDVARREAARAGLPDARITTDAKHVEIGLTDKSDSARWAFEELRRRGIAPGLVLVVGDEMGSLGGEPGSDALMLVPGADRATVVSVGVEPEGVPPPPRDPPRRGTRGVPIPAPGPAGAPAQRSRPGGRRGPRVDPRVRGDRPRARAGPRDPPHDRRWEDRDERRPAAP